jgi:hypothetical protein
MGQAVTRYVAAIVGAALLGAPIASAQELIIMAKTVRASSLSGVVSDPSGDGIPGAKVILISCPSNPYAPQAMVPKELARAIADSDGLFSLKAPVHLHIYCLRVSKDGFNSLQMSVCLSKSAGRLSPKLSIAA